jgi:hypothetical protein
MTSLERTLKWMNWFTPATFESNNERFLYSYYVQRCFTNNETPLWPLEWRKANVTVPRRPKHRADV